MGALFLLAASLPRTGGRPDNIFYPGLLGLLGVSIAILITETFVFRILLVEIAVGVITALLQGARFGSTRGAWRFFLFVTLALPFLLVAGWQIDFQAANPGQSDLLNPAHLAKAYPRSSDVLLRCSLIFSFSSMVNISGSVSDFFISRS